MKKVIYKYPLKVTDEQTLRLPVGAEILTVQEQDGTPCLWALVDPEEKETKDRLIEIHGTGNPFRVSNGDLRKYISTFQLRGGELVFHVFEYH